MILLSDLLEPPYLLSSLPIETSVFFPHPGKNFLVSTYSVPSPFPGIIATTVNKTDLTDQPSYRLPLDSIYFYFHLCGVTFTSICQQTFSVKDQRVNTLDFAGNTVSVTITQFCCFSTKAAKDNNANK